MRAVYVVTYDISSNRRVQKVYKAMRNWGDHLQLSVFLCHLTPMEKARMKTELADIINHKEDQIMLIRLGPEGHRADHAISTLGRAFVPTSRSAHVF